MVHYLAGYSAKAELIEYSKPEQVVQLIVTPAKGCVQFFIAWIPAPAGTKRIITGTIQTANSEPILAG